MSGTWPRATRRSAVRVIARRELRGGLRSAGFYTTLSVAVAGATMVLLTDVRSLEANGVLVAAHPFTLPLFVAVFVLSIYLAVSAAVSTARDRESGTLETLFFGPVDEIAYVGGKILGQVVVYLLALPLLLVCLLLLEALTSLDLTAVVIACLAASVLPAAEVVALGVLLGVGTNRIRTAVLLLGAAIIVLVGLSLAYSAVLLAPIDDPSDPMLNVRDALAAMDAALQWLSPFAHLEGLVDAVVSGAWRSVVTVLGSAAGLAAVLSALAVAWLTRRGVHRREE